MTLHHSHQLYQLMQVAPRGAVLLVPQPCLSCVAVLPVSCLVGPGGVEQEKAGEPVRGT